VQFQEQQPDQPLFEHVNSPQHGNFSPARLSSNTIVQGVPFHAGFHPHNGDIPASPVQDFSDSDSGGGSDLMVNFLLIDQAGFYQSNELLLTRFSQAKAMIKGSTLPKLDWDNSFFLAPPI
jgi:hypothetical protein